VSIVEADSQERVTIAHQLFCEYAESLGIDLCFQNFGKELATLPGEYVAPSGRLLLALFDGQPAGCVALRRIDDTTCEMKRLFVKPTFRGKNIGKQLAMHVMEQARGIGYARMLLDTLPSMKEAIALYRSLGFAPTEPYRLNPVKGALFMELKLQ